METPPDGTFTIHGNYIRIGILGLIKLWGSDMVYFNRICNILFGVPHFGIFKAVNKDVIDATTSN